LAAAFLVALGVLFALWIWRINFTGWVDGIAVGIVVVAGLFAVAVAVLFITTLFRINGGDLWDTTYFQYMRNVWGDKWGGSDDFPLSVSVCRAAWLSVITLLLWIVAIGLLVSLFYYLILGMVSGFENLVFLRSIESKNVVGIVIIFSPIPAALFGILYKIGFNFNLDCFMPKFRNTIFSIAIISVVFYLVMALIAIPIKYAGIDYLVAMGVIVGAIIFIIGIFFLIRNGIPKLTEFFVNKTASGALINMRAKGWKDKVCPLIVQKDTADETKKCFK
jgi:hypothetical protein